MTGVVRQRAADDVRFQSRRHVVTFHTMSGKYQLLTLGCKVNQYESQQIREVLHSIGLEPASPGDAADIAIVNTCAVTATATRKNRQAIRRAARNGQTAVVVIGCGASADAERLRALPHVTAVFGHDVNVCAELRRLAVDLFQSRSIHPPHHQAGQANNSQRRTDDIRNEISMNPAEAQPRWVSTSSATLSSPNLIVSLDRPIVKPNVDLTTDRIDSFEGRQRAFLKVQDGCDAFCSYCIIPRLRPRLRSKPIPAAVDEVRGLVEAGHREIIVTGIFLGAYGRETAIRKKWPQGRSPLADLILALAGVEGLQRLRISSLEPGDVDDDLLAVLAENDNCVPHLHLPLQAGSAAILRRMNRQYTVEAFGEMIDRVRSVLDRPAVSTDIIVGFPGETEEDFQKTLEMARYAQFSKIHAFPFSPREQTAAFRWQSEFVNPQVVRERMNRLADLERELSLAFRRQFVGETERVIVESSEKERRANADMQERSGEPSRLHHGRSDRYFEVYFEADDVRPGDLVSVRIERVTPTRTHGTLDPTRPAVDDADAKHHSGIASIETT